MKEKLGLIISGIAIFSFLVGGAVRFSMAENKIQTTQQAIQKISERLDYKINSDNYNSMRERLWALEEKYGDIDKIKDPIIKKEIKELREDIELQKEKLKEGIQ